MATFVRVVESGSLSAAAKQLRISSPAVSRQLTTLEEELGASLLTRTTRRLTITSAGQRYYECCLGILRDVESAQKIEKPDSIDGLLKITAPVTFGLACVVPHMKSLMKKHPSLVVELTLEDRLVDIMPEGVDVAIRVGSEPPHSTELIAQHLMTYRRNLVASPVYLKKHGLPLRPEALVKHAALMHFIGPVDTWILRQEAREVRVRPKVVFRSNALYALRDLAVDGAGVALLPEWFVALQLSSGSLQSLLGAWHPLPVAVNAVYRREQRGAQRVKALIEHLHIAFNAHEMASPTKSRSSL